MPEDCNDAGIRMPTNWARFDTYLAIALKRQCSGPHRLPGRSGGGVVTLGEYVSSLNCERVGKGDRQKLFGVIRKCSPRFAIWPLKPANERLTTFLNPNLFASLYLVSPIIRKRILTIWGGSESTNAVRPLIFGVKHV